MSGEEEPLWLTPHLRDSQPEGERGMTQQLLTCLFTSHHQHETLLTQLSTHLFTQMAIDTHTDMYRQTGTCVLKLTNILPFSSLSMY